MTDRNENTFSVYDYLVFAAMLLVSSIIGIYFACGGKQKSTKEYLMAGRDMSWFPIFVSLLASYLSAITLLGVPSEVYTYGIQYIVLILSYFILVGVGAYIFLPMFYHLQVVSSNEVSNSSTESSFFLDYLNAIKRNKTSVWRVFGGLHVFIS